MIYLLIESMPLVYAEMGVDAPNSSLFYFAMEVGFVLALLCYHFQLKAQAWATRRSGEDKPEYKLFWGMLSAFVFPVSMYWYGGTGQPDYSVWLPTVAIGLFGFASHILFIASHSLLANAPR